MPVDESLRRMYLDTIKEMEDQLKNFIFNSVPKEIVKVWHMHIEAYVNSIQTEDEKIIVTTTMRELTGQIEEVEEKPIIEKKKEERINWKDLPKEDQNKIINELEQTNRKTWATAIMRNIKDYKLKEIPNEIKELVKESKKEDKENIKDEKEEPEK